MERIHLGGRPVGFGDDLVERFEKAQDPLYACHHDRYVQLRFAGGVITGAAIVFGLSYLLRK